MKSKKKFQEVMKEMPMNASNKFNGFFLRFRKSITESYTEIFGEESDEREYATARSVFAKKWGWYQSVYALAKGNVLDFEQVTKLPVFQCLNYLAFEKEKLQIEEQEIKKAYKR